MIYKSTIYDNEDNQILFFYGVDILVVQTHQIYSRWWQNYIDIIIALVLRKW